MSVALRISRRSAPSLRLPQEPVFRDEHRRIILGAPEPEVCPYCARRDRLVIVSRPGLYDATPQFQVCCLYCDAEGPPASSRRAAAHQWNEHGVTPENRLHRLLCGPGEA